MTNTLAKQRRRFILISLAIPVALLVAFVVVPAADLIRMSFTNWDGLSIKSDFVGLDNYISMFHNADLWQSLKNNAVYFFVHLCMIPIELAFAVLLTSKLRAAKFYKTMVFLPYIINGVAISYAFSYFFSPVNGAFDGLLEAIKLGMLSRSWLSDPQDRQFCAGICFPVALLWLPYRAVHVGTAVGVQRHSGSCHHRWSQHMADVPLYSDPLHYADGGLYPVRQHPRCAAGL